MNKNDALDNMRKWIERSIKIKQEMMYNELDYLYAIVRAAELLARTIENGNKILVCGNGGSASDSAHFVAELMNRFSLMREYPLPAIDLSAMNSTITAIANDYEYKYVFSKQVEALAKRGDILFAISTSGTSENIIEAIDAAIRKKIYCVLLTGMNYESKDHYLLKIRVPSKITPAIQEAHIMIIHMICDYIDNYLRV